MVRNVKLIQDWPETKVLLGMTNLGEGDETRRSLSAPMFELAPIFCTCAIRSGKSAFV